MNNAASGDSFLNDGRVLLYIENSDGSSHTCTLDDPNSPTPEGAVSANPDAVLTIANGAKKVFGPFPRSRFNDADGLVQMTWSSTTGMTWAVFGT